MNTFDYDAAFSRNIGWVTEAEQARLRQSRVAIGGLGGVGGVHLLTLARLGIGKFSIADFDVFEIANFNRQVGATMHSLERAKIDVLERNVQVRSTRKSNCEHFHRESRADSLDSFLDGVDVYVDGLDFFAFDARRMTFAACEAKGIPVVTAAPAGHG